MGWVCRVIGDLLVAGWAVVVAVGGGLNVGTLLRGAAVAVLVVYAMCHGRLEAASRRGVGKSVKLAVLLAAAVWACSVVAISGLIISSSFAKSERGARWLVVLGAGLRGDRPSLTLQARLDTALAYLDVNPETKVVVSGGRGLEETITEAEAMSRFFERRGISPERIFKEEKSTSTLENLLFSKPILAANGAWPGEVVGVVSSEFHIFRVKMLARRFGLNIHPVAAPTPWYLLPNCLLREYFAIVKSLLLDSPSSFPAG